MTFKLIISSLQQVSTLGSHKAGSEILLSAICFSRWSFYRILRHCLSKAYTLLPHNDFTEADKYSKKRVIRAKASYETRIHNTFINISSNYLIQNKILSELLALLAGYHLPIVWNYYLNCDLNELLILYLEWSLIKCNTEW